MEISWTKHLKTKEDRDKVTSMIKHSKGTLDILINILNKELESLETTSTEDYGIPNWQCFQADRNGYKRALKRFINLINIKE